MLTYVPNLLIDSNTSAYLLYLYILSISKCVLVLNLMTQLCDISLLFYVGESLFLSSAL